MCGVRIHCFLGVAVVTAALGAARAEAQIQAMPFNTAYDQAVLEDVYAGPSYPMDSPAGPDSLSVLHSPQEFVPADLVEPPRIGSREWEWQPLPSGLLYRNYLANNHEPRLGTLFFYERDRGWLWDAALGAHVGILRFGSRDPILGEGFQLDAEGGAFVRLDLEEDRDVDSTDYHFGFPLTYRMGMWEAKFGYYHLCSHLADEWLQKHPGWRRYNYVRDSLVLGLAMRPVPDVRVYAEADWGIIYVDDGAGRWHFQFGVDYSPMRPSGWMPDPFFAVNGRIQEELDFGGNITAQVGWQWRNPTGRLLRMGFQYFNGKSNQFQFHPYHEEQYGFGIWYDF